MADPKPVAHQNDGEAQRTSKALADAAMTAEERQMDEMPLDGGAVIDGQPVGGVYIVNGVKVGPDGKPLGSKKD